MDLSFELLVGILLVRLPLLLSVLFLGHNHLELEETAAVLHPENVLVLETVGAIELDQGAEFRLLVLDVELVVGEDYFSVGPGNRNIDQPDFALVAPADPDLGVLLGGDQVQAPLLLGHLARPVEALQDDVGLGGLGNGHHLDFLAVEFDDLGERPFTDFALELGEIVRSSNVADLLLHLAVDPLPQTAHMDFLHAPLAQAGRDQGVLFSLLGAQTNFAPHFAPGLGRLDNRFIFLKLEYPVVLVKMVGVPNGQGVLVVAHLDDHVLDSAHFDDIPRLYIIRKLLKG